MSMESCLEKQDDVKKLFQSCATEEEKYNKLIELGKKNPPLNDKYKVEGNVVPGCQSIMYLHTELKEGKVNFQAESNALISSGLAAVLLMVYSGEEPDVILKCPPDYLEELGISTSLTPSRANGLYSIHLKMKQDALKLLVNQSKTSR